MGIDSTQNRMEVSIKADLSILLNSFVFWFDQMFYLITIVV